MQLIFQKVHNRFPSKIKNAWKIFFFSYLSKYYNINEDQLPFQANELINQRIHKLSLIELVVVEFFVSPFEINVVYANGLLAVSVDSLKTQCTN